MKHIVEEWHQNMCDSVLWDFYFSGMSAGSLDIETTGLDPSRCAFILGGIYCGETQKLHQVFAQNRAEEAAALEEYMQILDDLDLVITYNGKLFDLPFLDKRLAGVSSRSCRHLYDLDLYQVLSGHSPIRKFVPNMQQKTIEAYMGLWDTRADEISGAESVDLYYRYESTKDPDAEARILLHNNDDVRQLTRLTKAITKSDFHKAMFRIGFPVKAGGRMLTVKSIKLRKDSLQCSGIQNRAPADYIGFEYNNWPVASHFEGDEFQISVPVVRQSGITAIDLTASGLQPAPFEDYPGCASGFLVIEDTGGIKYRETNHFIKEFLKKFMEENL